MNLIALAIFAPLAAAVLILLIRRSPSALALLGMGLGLIAATGLLVSAFGGTSKTLVLPGLPDMPLQLIASPLTALLSAMVAVISTFVLIYGVGYMKIDPEKPRFFATVLFFVTAMQMLVLAGDWITLLAAWELIGFSSFLLIGFWYRRAGVASAATRAFIYTRSADLGLYTGAFLLIATSGSTEISVTLSTGGAAATIAGLLLLVAAIGKSAQAPLYDWLARAMVGPTPVSALLHSAALVAAGAILLIRIAPMLTPGTLLAVGVVGGITTVLTGMIALAESDLKRLLAASTSSQYGLMLVAVAAGAPIAAVFHLIAHAAIKSALFTGSGVFQHSRESTGLDTLKGAGRDHPLVFAGFALAALALAGIPPLSGFFSKDTIIAAALNAPDAAWLAPVALLSTLLTGAYMARTLRVLWHGARQDHPLAGLAWMGAGLAGLTAIAVILGAAFPFVSENLGMKPPENGFAMILGLGAALGGLALGWFVPVSRLLGPLLPWARKGFVVAGGFDASILRPVLAFARACDRLEHALYGAVLVVMLHPALAIARACDRLEKGLFDAVLTLGRTSMHIGFASRKADQDGIDRMIFGLVHATVALGGRARRLQSGLVHRELALTFAGTGLLAMVAVAVFMIY